MDKLLTVLFRIFAFFVLKLPEKWRWGLGKGIGKLASLFLPARVRLTMENLQASGYSPEESKCINAQVWKAIGLVGAEFIYYLLGSSERLVGDVEWEGEENLRQALALGKGVIIASAHIGNWEMMGVSLGLKYPVVAIARKQENAGFNLIIDQGRKKAVRLVPMKASMKPIISALRQNELAVFILDQRGRGVNCEFLGREARFFVGAATFALRTGAAILPTRLIRVRPGKYRLIIDPPVEPVNTGDSERDAQETTVRIMRALERHVRETPEQWLWMHKLWPSKIKV